MTVTLGLNGDLKGTCVLCLIPTDTAICVEGEPEAIVRLLHQMGLPVEAAAAHVVEWLSQMPLPVPVRICTKCAADSDLRLPAPKLILPGYGVPLITAPGAPQEG